MFIAVSLHPAGDRRAQVSSERDVSANAKLLVNHAREARVQVLSG